MLTIKNFSFLRLSGLKMTKSNYKNGLHLKNLNENFRLKIERITFAFSKKSFSLNPF